MAGAFQDNAFQNTAFQLSGRAGAARAGAGGRRIAYDPKLDVAFKASDFLFYRARSRQLPLLYTQHTRKTRLTSKTARSRVNSASMGAKFAYTGGSYASTAPHTDPETWPDVQPK